MIDSVRFLDKLIPAAIQSRMKNLISILLICFVVSSCHPVPVSVTLKIDGIIETPDGVPITEESFTLCAKLNYSVQGQAQADEKCKSILSDKNGHFSESLRWSSSAYTNEKGQNPDIIVTDYSVYIKGSSKPGEIIEGQKAAIKEVWTHPELNLQAKFQINPMDLKVVKIIHQVELVKTESDRASLLKDFLSSYQRNLTSEQISQMAKALSETSDRDQLVLDFYISEKPRLNAEDRLKLAQVVSSSSQKNKIIND